MENDENNLIEEKEKFVDTLFDEDKEVTIENNDTIIVKKKKKKLNVKVVIIVLVALVVIAAITIVILYVKGIIGNNKPSDEDNLVVLEDDNFRYENGFLIFLNNNGDDLGQYECQIKDSTKCFVAHPLDEDNFNAAEYVNENGTKYEKSTRIYFERYVFVNDSEKVLLYDMKDNKVLNTFKSVKTGNIDKYYVVVIDEENKYGLMEIEKDNVGFIMDPTYNYLAIYQSDSKFLTKNENNEEYIVDIQGNAISPTFDHHIKAFDDKNIIAIQDNKYSLYNYQGITLTYDEEFIDLNQSYIAIINNNNLVLYDSDFNKINEDSIKLNNNYYLKKFIIDKNHTLKETLKAYDLIIEDNKIKVEFESNKKTVNYVYNLNDVINSKKFSYVRYISYSFIKDASSMDSENSSYLYFYSDENKTNLIGSYKCSVQNSENLNNCFIAKSTNILYNNKDKYMPIISNQYAFIYDKGTIILYDFVNNETIAKYKEVESNFAKDGVTLIKDDNYLFTCKNANDNYGIIAIYLDNINSVVPFKITQEGKAEYTQSIKLLNSKYFYVERNGMNYVYDQVGDVVAKSTFEITDYLGGYYVVKEDNKNYVVNSSGQMITDRLDYIKLYDSYFIGIDSNKLNVYAYAQAKEAILDPALDIYDTNYANAYEFENGLYTHEISIKNTDGTFVKHVYNNFWNEVS